MAVVHAFVGDVSPSTWRRLSLVLVGQFLGMLMLAWVLRSPDVAPSTPFRNVISTLGQGRGEGNGGAWIFCACFCTFAFLLIPWHLHLAREVWRVNRTVAGVLALVATVSMTGAACVGIFDEQAMGPISQHTSRVLHGFGAATAFGGHSVVVFVSWLVFATVYWRASEERRQAMPHPAKLLVSVLGLVLVLVCFGVAPGYRQTAVEAGWGPTAQLVFRHPFWQWSLMLALMNWLFSMSRWFPDSLVETVEPG